MQNLANDAVHTTNNAGGIMSAPPQTTTGSLVDLWPSALPYLISLPTVDFGITCSSHARSGFRYFSAVCCNTSGVVP